MSAKKKARHFFVGVLMVVSATTAHGADDLFTQHNKLMLDSIRICNAERVRKLLATPYVEVNSPQPPGVTYLDLAIGTNCTDDQKISIIKILLDNGANPLGGRDNSTTPIFLTIIISMPRSAIKVIDLLISHGADVNTPLDWYGNYSNLLVHYGVGPPQATSAEITDILKLLHKKGLKLLAFDRKGRTPVINAAITRINLSYMDYVIKAGIPVELRDDCGWAAIDYTQFDGGLKIAPENRNNSPEIVAKSKIFYDYLIAAGGSLQQIPRVDPCISKR